MGSARSVDGADRDAGDGARDGNRVPAAGGLGGMAAIQRSIGNRATAELIRSRRTAVQRHALPTQEAGWEPPPSPPGIWAYLTRVFSRRSTPTTPSTGGATATATTTSSATTAAPTTAPTTGGTTAPPTPTGGTTTPTTPTTTTTAGGTTTATPTTTTTTGTGGSTTPPTTGATATTASAAPTSSLTSSGSFAAYATAATTIRSNWATYADADARGRALGQAAIAALTGAGVHPPTIAMADLPAGNGGNFAFSGWTLTLARLPFAPATFSDAVFNNAYEVVYHEARHCEQWFRMARLRAGAGRTAAQIRTDMGIDATAAAQAFANPITAGSAEAAAATVWWDSVYGTGSANRGVVLTEVLAALNANNAAQAAHTAAPTPATQLALTAAQTRFGTAYAAYRALPEEADAFGTEASLRTALATARAAAATPPPTTAPTTTPTPAPTGG